MVDDPLFSPDLDGFGSPPSTSHGEMGGEGDDLGVVVGAGGTKWREAHVLLRNRTEQERDRQRAAAKEHARALCREAKAKADEEWRQGRLKECVAHLDTALLYARDSDVLHRYRSRCHSRQGGPRGKEVALQDARDAAKLSPRGPANHYVLGRCLERSDCLLDSAAAYLCSMRLGQAAPDSLEPPAERSGQPELEGPYHNQSPRAGIEGRYTCLLEAMRRRREFPNLHMQRSGGERGGGGAGASASSHRIDKTNETWTGRRHASIFDPRKKLEERVYGGGGSSTVTPDPPKGLRLVVPSGGGGGGFRPVREDGELRGYSCTVVWEEPLDDGGDEIFTYTVQVQRYDVRWDPQAGDLFDGFKEWATEHEGPARVRSLEIGALGLNRPLRVRVCCKNGEGLSNWSETLELHTPSPGGSSADEHVTVPKSWLRLPIHEVLLEHVRDNGGTPEDFLVELGTAVRPHVHDIRRIFKMYAASGGGAHATSALTPMQFGRFARDAGLHTGTNPATKERNGLRPVLGAHIDLVYQQSVAHEVHSRTKAWKAAQTLAKEAEEAVEEAAVVVKAEEDRAKEEEEGEEARCMGLKEFVGALVRLAWQQLRPSSPSPDAAAHPNRLRGVGARLTAFLVGAVLPSMEKKLAVADPMLSELARPRVRAILEHHDKDLRQIFASYAAADMGVEAQAAQDSVNLAELMFMVKEGKLIDANLSVSAVSQIFSTVNAQSEEEEDGDDDESELVYDEWVQVIARCCNAKIPEEARGGEPFEYTLQSWLQLVFVPTYKRLLKEKARGSSPTAFN